jgi:hypothetical protein
MRVRFDEELAPFVKVSGELIPISQLLEMRDPPQEARDFREHIYSQIDKIEKNDSLRAAAVGQAPAHIISRSLNGKLAGGTRGEDRKDWPTYIARHLSDVTGLLGCNEKNREKRWTNLTPEQREAIQDATATAISKWPTPYLEHIAKLIRDETKLR